MSIRSRLGAAWRGLASKGDEPITSSLDLFKEIYGGRSTSAGISINWTDILSQSTGLACARVITEGVSQVPFRLMKEDASGKKPAIDHPLFNLLYRRPNPWQTSFEFRETVCLHALLTYNAFVFVNRAGIRREIKELIPIEPGRVTVEQLDDYRLQYKVRGKNGQEQTFSQDAIWHIRGPSWNSWQGMDAVKMTREAIGLTVAIERDQSHLYKNGLRTSGTYSMEGTLTEDQYKGLRKFIKDYQADEGGGPLILDRSAKYLSETMKGVDAQTLESRRMQVEEICRGFRVMPIMVGHADKTATYASAEQMFLAHVVHTLSPWYKRIEESADVNLLTPEDIAAGYYTKFNANALMKGAAKDRAEFYAKALGSGGSKGWMTQNDVRGLEDLDKSDDPDADKLPQPAANAAPAKPSADPEPGDE